MKRKSKILYILFLAIISAPLVNGYLKITKSGSLRGFFTNAKDTNYTVSGWMNGSYQSIKDDYLNDHMSFREDLVRLNGQIDYSIFANTEYGGTMKAQDGSLYFDNYVASFDGEDFLGNEKIRSIVSRLKLFEEMCNKHHVKTVFVQAPNKAFYNQDHFWAKYDCFRNNPTNYEVFNRIADSLNLNYVDVNSWFRGARGLKSDSLFTKKGIHWTIYGSVLAGDSIFSYLEHKYKTTLPRPKIISIEHTTKPRYSDPDIADLLNLIFPLKNETYSYPVLNNSKSSDSSLKVVVIGDSFVWGLVQSKFLDCVSPTWEYWYYFNTVFDRSNQNAPLADISNYDWKNSLKKADIVVILYTTSNISRIEGAYLDYDFK